MARTRHVFPTAQVAHIWAQRNPEQVDGRSGGRSNLYFEGDTIYSYGGHFPIATFIENGKFVLFTNDGYSSTTAKHKGYVARALFGRDVTVLYVDGNPLASRMKRSLQRLVIMKNGQLQVDLELGKAQRARLNTQDHLYEAERIARDFNHYAEHVRIKTRVVIEPDGIRMERLERQAEDQRVKRRRADKKAEKERAVSTALQVEQFRAGKPFGFISLEFALLRVKGGDTIESSLGAEFPLSHGERAFKLIAAVRKNGKPWESNGGSIHVGHFVIDAIGSDGTVKAGCHVIEWSEMEALASEQGWI